MFRSTLATLALAAIITVSQAQAQAEDDPYMDLRRTTAPPSSLQQPVRVPASALDEIIAERSRVAGASMEVGLVNAGLQVAGSAGDYVKLAKAFPEYEEVILESGIRAFSSKSARELFLKNASRARTRTGLSSLISSIEEEERLRKRRREEMERAQGEREKREQAIRRLQSRALGFTTPSGVTRIPY